MNSNKLCLTAAEISAQTGISLSLVRKLTRCGKIPHIRVGRRILYPLKEIEDWLSQNTISKDGAVNG